MRNWIFLLFLALAVKTSGQLTYAQLRVDYDSAILFRNIKIIPIRFKGPGNPGNRAMENTVGFSQALARGLIRVEERGTSSIENVHQLSLYNNSDKNIFVSSGEILAGGRQDRMVSRDTLIQAYSGRIDLPVMCVEEGRWSEKNRRFIYQRMAGSRLRKVLDMSKNQVLIWKEISDQLEADKIRNKSLSYLSRYEDKKFLAMQKEYAAYLMDRFRRTDSTITGIVCMTGNRILGSDIFISPRLFYDQLEPLLAGYVEDAMVIGSPPIVKDAEVKHYLDQFLTNEPGQEEFLRKNGKMFKVKGQIIHLTTY
jgi:hypothetical protein